MHGAGRGKNIHTNVWPKLRSVKIRSNQKISRSNRKIKKVQIYILNVSKRMKLALKKNHKM